MARNDHDPDELVAVELAPDEVYLLTRGITEWNGAARCSDEVAVAMGFSGVSELRAVGPLIADRLEAGQAISRRDWSRCLLSTEIVFISMLMGCAFEWSTIFGATDAETIVVLREVQEKLSKVCVPIGHMVYTFPRASLEPNESDTDLVP